MTRIIVDANVWLRFARSRNLFPLRQRLLTHQLVPVANNYLLAEIYNVLIENKWMAESQAKALIELIASICIIRVEKANFALSPDPKDNYLIDLALQFHCAFIVSDDKLLAKIPLLPVSVYDTDQFLSQFPLDAS